MSKPQVVIHDAATGETVQRDMTDDEIARLEADRAEFAKQKADEEKEATKRASDKQALLDKLGISEDEARLLLSS